MTYSAIGTGWRSVTPRDGKQLMGVDPPIAVWRLLAVVLGAAMLAELPGMLT